MDDASSGSIIHVLASVKNQFGQEHVYDFLGENIHGM